jgi:hypothetical protein
LLCEYLYAVGWLIASMASGTVTLWSVRKLTENRKQKTEDRGQTSDF